MRVDYDECDAERIGYAMCTIKNGERVSSAGPSCASR